jgi:hypothetical protein
MGENSQLLAFVGTEEITDVHRNELRHLVESISVPSDAPIEVNFVDEIEPAEDARDAPIVTVGLIATLPRRAKSASEDRACLEVIRTIIGRLCAWSATSGAELELEWDQQYVGSIDAGRPSEGITETLLGEWERQLG